ncbi:hypothetical protein CPB85DRAFT_1252725 [Mucidula mucida]|nr:hypothetical protein CPB85DRAFT_1252725 [Mucidula mucida]
MSDSYLSEDLAAWKHAVASRDSQVKDHFPELEPGFFDPETARHVAQACLATRVGSLQSGHPSTRIVAFLGLADYDQYIRLQYHPLGDLWTYIAEKSPPLSLRIQWAVEVAEGIAHLHAKSIVWADAHLRNILVTEDLHASWLISRTPSSTRLICTRSQPPLLLSLLGQKGIEV